MSDPKKIDITPPMYPVVGKYHKRVHFYANTPGMKLFLSELPKEHIGWPLSEGICISQEAYELWGHVDQAYETKAVHTIRLDADERATGIDLPWEVGL